MDGRLPNLGPIEPDAVDDLLELVNVRIAERLPPVGDSRSLAPVLVSLESLLEMSCAVCVQFCGVSLSND